MLTFYINEQNNINEHSNKENSKLISLCKFGLANYSVQVDIRVISNLPSSTVNRF